MKAWPVSGKIREAPCCSPSLRRPRNTLLIAVQLSNGCAPLRRCGTQRNFEERKFCTRGLVLPRAWSMIPARAMRAPEVDAGFQKKACLPA
jgi:hypothetical protein